MSELLSLFFSLFPTAPGRGEWRERINLFNFTCCTVFKRGPDDRSQARFADLSPSPSSRN